MTTISALYLGNFDIELDPEEGNMDAEGSELSIRGIRGQNLNLRSRIFGSADDPLHEKVVTIETTSNDDDPNSDVLRVDREESVDTLTFNLRDGQGEQTTEFDAYIQYAAPTNFSGGATPQVRVYYSDGTAASFREIDLIQDANGNLFLVFDGLRPGQNNLLNQGTIERIVFSSTANATDGRDFDPTSEPSFQGSVICYARGTKIDTISGSKEIEQIVVDDLVLTADRGYQPVVWIGSRIVNQNNPDYETKQKPIRIRAGALGQETPMADLYVSPQHRVLVSGKIVERLSGDEQAFVAAKYLIDFPGIDYAEGIFEVEYFHLLLADHEVIFAEEAASESLYLGSETLKTLSQQQCDEIQTLLPRSEVGTMLGASYPLASRAFLKRRMALDLIRRLQKNQHQLNEKHIHKSTLLGYITDAKKEKNKDTKPPPRASCGD